jgi:hypothetical protein
MAKRRTGRSGQSLVEFTMVVAAFVIVTFAAISAAFHSVQRASAETAAAAGVQLAASGSANDPGQPALGASFGPTQQLLRTVMWNTAVVQGDKAACDGMATAIQGHQQRDGTLMVCAYPDPANPALVAERIVGVPAYILPLVAQYVPWSIDVTVEMHQVSYQG